MNTDPIADMLTRIRNANMVSLTEVDMPSSKLKVELAKLLKSEGYVEDYAVVEKEGSAFKTLKITLKYDEKSKPVISNLKRISRPGLRNYCKAKSSTSIRWYGHSYNINKQRFIDRQKSKKRKCRWRNSLLCMVIE